MIERFQSPEFLNLIWAVPLLWLVNHWMRQLRMKKLAAHVDKALVEPLTASGSIKHWRWKFRLELLALLMMIVAMARPQSGESRQEVKSEGVEVLFLVDVSTSMLAEDVAPSRLALAKKEIGRFLDRSLGDRIGLIAFAGSALLLSPMTPDRGALRMFVDSLDPTSVSNQGTQFKRALQEAKSALARGGLDGSEVGKITKVVVIVSDGEDQEPGALEFAKELANDDVRIFVLAVGTENGGPIPIRDERGILVEYKKDRSGEPVMTKTRGTVLKELAQMGGGGFYHLTFGGNAVDLLLQDINKLRKTEFGSGETVAYRELYQFFLFLSLVFAGAALLISVRRKSQTSWKGRFQGAAS